MTTTGAIELFRVLLAKRFHGRHSAFVALALVWGAVYPISLFFHGVRYGWSAFQPSGWILASLPMVVILGPATLSHAFFYLFYYFASPIPDVAPGGWAVPVFYWLGLVALNLAFVRSRRLIIFLAIVFIVLCSTVRNFELVTKICTVT